MELKKMIEPLRRWWWLLLIATLMAGAFSFLATRRQAPVYQASTTLMIGQAIKNPNPTGNEFFLSQQLASTYADMANRELVANATMKALGMAWLPQYTAKALPNSQLIQIDVVDTDPQRAAAVANELANQLALNSPTASVQSQANETFINQQITDIKTQIQETNKEIIQLQAQLGNLNSARQISDAQNQIAALQAKLATLQANYANLFSLTQGGAINTINVIEPASPPSSPIGPNRLLSILLAAICGFVLAAVAAYTVEYFDDTLKTPEDVDRVIQAPILGYIPEMGNTEKVYVVKNPRNPVVDAYRTLRTNLDFAGVDQPLRSLFISSSDIDVGKTSLACNLAAVVAQAEKKVILLDADMRRPTIHQFFGIPKGQGLSDIFLDRLSIEDVLREIVDANIQVITAGAEPPNPTELLGSQKMSHILSQLITLADVVIVDGPPFVVADAAVLAAKTDGVLLVVRPEYIHEGAARSMMEQVRRTGARVVGVAMNRVSPKSSYYYAGNRRYRSSYYSYPGGGDDSSAGDGGSAGGAGSNGNREKLRGVGRSIQRRLAGLFQLIQDSYRRSEIATTIKGRLSDFLHSLKRKSETKRVEPTKETPK